MNYCGTCKFFTEGCKSWDGDEYKVLDYECGCEESDHYEKEVRDIDDACEEYIEREVVEDET